MSNTKVVITGAPRDLTRPQGNIAPRLEINDFIKNEKYFSLYVQALSKNEVSDHARQATHIPQALCSQKKRIPESLSSALVASMDGHILIGTSHLLMGAATACMLRRSS
jgi:hypothetical protein